MSKHQEWKMIHLLYRYGRRSSAGDWRVLTETQLTGAGVHCDADTRQPLKTPASSGASAPITARQAGQRGLRRFTAAQGPDVSVDLPSIAGSVRRHAVRPVVVRRRCTRSFSSPGSGMQDLPKCGATRLSGWAT